MTENEAIKWQKSFKKTYNGFPPETEEACDMAIKALEEVQQYREIGTIKEIKIREAQFARLAEGYLNDLTLLREYQTIGTAEEFKALKEKETPKKPILSKSMITEKEYQICPICERLALYDGIKFDYCQYCGQKLDWEGGE